jgi:hypothetical protein
MCALRRPVEAKARRSPSAARVAGLLAALLGWLASGWALACPVCETETGRQIRAGIFDASFPRYLVISLLPFAVVTLAVVLVPRLLRDRKAGPR